jgi:steroid 5-alpha reductase family enzyme
MTVAVDALAVLGAWLFTASLMVVLWLVAPLGGNAGVVDVAWALATGLVGVGFAALSDGNPTRRAIVGILAAAWALRLAGHLYGRVRREAEDGRYRELRERWGSQARRNLFWFYQAQAFWAVMFALPMLAASRNAEPIGALDSVAVGIWIVSVVGEAVADAQLARFKANSFNHGAVCRAGLWRYSRHPNYFFEWLHWWAYAALAAGGPAWWIAVGGAFVMLWFLTHVTGIPPTEAQALRSRGDAYREYQRTTNAFFPWPPMQESRR